MPTVVFLSSKGGAGKSTAALVLALGLARRNERVAIVDADPNLPLYRWGALPDKPTNVMVFGAASAEEVRDVRPFAETWADWVIFDTEGSMRARNLVPVIEPDLALIPLGPSPLEALEAIRTARALKEMAGPERAPIPHACVFTRLQAAIRPRSFSEAVRQLKGEGIPIVETPLIEKEAFRVMFSCGGGIESLDPARVSGLEAARLNAEQYAESIYSMFHRVAAEAPAPSAVAAAA